MVGKHSATNKLPKMKSLFLLWVLATACNALSRQQRKFPDDFTFGAATASYQIEGAWDADGKSENIWDHLTHTKPELIADRSNGDVAANSYENYKRDVEMMRELGLDAYRFSLSWTRILPSGYPDKISEAGVAFYNNYIDEMLKYNITPMATLFHWDLPQNLQDLGGFANPLIVEWFDDYARVAYALFGDRVKHWITFNEPYQICYLGYGSTGLAPILNATGVGDYLCAKNLVVAHARAYRTYSDEFRASQGGECGITISVPAYEPVTYSERDQLAAELKRQGEWVIYAEPIFSEEGGFPKELYELVAKKSAEQGFSRSRLPDFTEEEKALARGSSDFFGVNHYSANYVYANDKPTDVIVPSLADDIGSPGIHRPSVWIESASGPLFLSPNSIYKVLTDVQRRYNNPKMYITENGLSTEGTNYIEDDDRAQFYRGALESVLDCIDAGVNIKGYMAWSLMDNYEWTQGYTKRFGLYEVDFESPARTRTPRKSAFVYKQVVKTRVIDHEYEPETRVMTIDEGH